MKIIPLNDGRFLIKVRDSILYGNDPYHGDWVTISSISDENVTKAIRECTLDEGTKEIMSMLRDLFIKSTEIESAKLRNELRQEKQISTAWRKAVEELGKEINEPSYKTHVIWSEITRLVKLQKVRDEDITKMVERAGSQGHNKPCYYCGKKTNNLAGDPGQWGIPLCHKEEPGVTKWHHTRCVSERLAKLEKLEILETLNKEEK